MLTHTPIGPFSGHSYGVGYRTPGCTSHTIVATGMTFERALEEAERLNQGQEQRAIDVERSHELRNRTLGLTPAADYLPDWTPEAPARQEPGAATIDEAKARGLELIACHLGLISHQEWQRPLTPASFQTHRSLRHCSAVNSAATSSFPPVLSPNTEAAVAGLDGYEPKPDGCLECDLCSENCCRGVRRESFIVHGKSFCRLLLRNCNRTA